ncbi:MAG: transposase, partial [Planctomycetia bacterium]
MLTERVRTRLVRWFLRHALLDAEAAADLLAWENSGFSIDASVRIALVDRDVPTYSRSLEHLLRYCARPAFALERLSLHARRDSGPDRIRYTLPRHKRGQWGGPGRKRTATAPGNNGVVDLSAGEFLDRLADLVPPPRRHRHRYHGVCAEPQAAESRHGARDREHRQAERRWACGRGACHGLLPAGMGTKVTPREAALTRLTSRDLTTRRGLRGQNSWPGWGRSFRSSART